MRIGKNGYERRDQRRARNANQSEKAEFLSCALDGEGGLEYEANNRDNCLNRVMSLECDGDAWKHTEHNTIMNKT